MKELKSNYDLSSFISALNELSKISKSLHRLYELHCYGDLTPRQEKRLKRLEDEAIKLCQEFGLYCYIQTDPRGSTIYISMDPIDARDYNKGVCIF